MNYIEKNIKKIKEEIKSAKLKSNRQDEVVEIVAVSKTFENEIIEESIKNGVEIIAENRVQEVLRKFPLIKSNVRKHFIGHLQRNKARQIVKEVELIHSVDSIRLINEIEKQARNKDHIQEILIQVNIAREEQKYGFKVEELEEVLEKIETCKHISLRGMMMMAPFTDNQEETRQYFRSLKEIYDKINQSKSQKMDILSMGMSNDFKVAIEEGSTMVRIGRGIYSNK